MRMFASIGRLFSILGFLLFLYLFRFCFWGIPVVVPYSFFDLLWCPGIYIVWRWGCLLFLVLAFNCYLFFWIWLFPIFFCWLSFCYLLFIYQLFWLLLVIFLILSGWLKDHQHTHILRNLLDLVGLVDHQTLWGIRWG